MKRVPLIALTVALLALQGCDLDGNHGTEREVADFHSIAIGDGVDVTVHQGERYAVSVKTDGGDLDSLNTTVEDGKLIITKSHSWIWFFTLFDWWSHYSADVTLPKLDYLSARSGSKVISPDEFNGDALELIAGGGSNLDIKGRYRSITVRSSGGAGIKLAGSVEKFNVRTSGGSSVRAMQLEAQEADLVTSGGSSIAVTVLDKLKARASGGSNIRYGGHPPATDIRASGGGDIIAR